MNHWAKDIVWLEQLFAHRTLTSASWLGIAVVAQSWRLPFTAIAAAFRRRPGGTRVRMTPVSRAWLQQYEADSIKHEHGR